MNRTDRKSDVPFFSMEEIERDFIAALKTEKTFPQQLIESSLAMRESLRVREVAQPKSFHHLSGSEKLKFSLIEQINGQNAYKHEQRKRFYLNVQAAVRKQFSLLEANAKKNRK